MGGISPVIIGALINEVAIPELVRFLAELHAGNRLLTEEEALAKLNMDAESGNAAGRAFLESHGGT